MKSTKRIFNVASYKRRGALIKMLESIYDQADVINVIINIDNKSEIPNAINFCIFLQDSFPDKLQAYHLFNYQYGDSAKFLFLPFVNGYFFTVDDDLLYPPDYAEKLIEKYEQFNGDRIVALHGRNFKQWPIDSYYNSPFDAYRVLGDVKDDVLVEFAGTCTTMWHTDLLRFYPADIKSINMGDIWLSFFSKQKNIPIMVIAHESGWVNYLLDKGDDTIFVNYKKSHDAQTDLANLIYGQTE